MAENNWINKINPFKQKDNSNGDIQKLKAQLDDALDTMNDFSVKSIQTSKEDSLTLSSELKYYRKGVDATSEGVAEGTSGDSIVDLDALQRVFISETWVYNAVMAIAETIAAIPTKLERLVKVKKEVVNQVTGQKEIVEEGVWVPATAERLSDIFKYPNPECTKSDFLMLLIIDILTTGEYFIHLEGKKGVDLSLIEDAPLDDNPKTPFGRLRQLLAGDTPVKHMWRLPPSIMSPVIHDVTGKVVGYRQVAQGTQYVYGTAEIIHVKYPNPQNSFRGLAPLIPVFKQILLDRYTTEHHIRFYKSGARLGGVVETEKNLNKEGLGRFQKSFENNYTGKQNHHRTLVLPPGMTYRVIESSPIDASLIEFSKYNREAILSTFRVPPIKVGIMDGANYANARAQLSQFYSDCIMPKLTFIQDGFNRKASLMPDNKSYRVRFDLTDIPEAQEDLAMKATTGTAMLASGLTVNEVRKIHWRLEPIEGGDVSIPLKGASAPAPNPLAGFALDVKPEETKAEISPPSDVIPTQSTFTDRVNVLVGQLVQSGTPLALAIPQAIEQARLEGFTDEVVDATSSVCADCNTSPCTCPPDDGKALSLSEFISDSLGRLDPTEKVDADFINELIAIFEGEKETIVDSITAIIPEETPTALVPVTLRAEHFGFTKEALTSLWKDAMGKADPLIEKRVTEVRKFFKGFQSVVLNRLGATIKAYGMRKAGDNEDIDDILKLEAYDEIVKQYIKEIDAALLEAYEGGYNSVLTTFSFGDPNEEALKFLKEFGAKNVKLITDTTMEQMRTVLSDAFEKGLTVGEVSGVLRDKFTEIDQGRAVTIARTETLTAVSAGQEAKTQDFVTEYPDKKLLKTWISSQDDRVRDSHASVDGEVVEVDKSFSNGLAYPREAGQAAEEVINCRCSWTTFAEEDQAIVSEALNPNE